MGPQEGIGLRLEMKSNDQKNCSDIEVLLKLVFLSIGSEKKSPVNEGHNGKHLRSLKFRKLILT